MPSKTILQEVIALNEKEGLATFDYIEEAQQTLSDKFYGDYLPGIALDRALANAIHALQELDKIKKLLFYGKGALVVYSANCDHFETKAEQNILHGIIGKATEAGELLEWLVCMIDHLKNGNVDDLDISNVLEEIGDGFWYDAILAKTLGFNFGDAQITNIAKLRARYPEKFTEYDANNRNLQKEQKVLKEGLDKAKE